MGGEAAGPLAPFVAFDDAADPFVTLGVTIGSAAFAFGAALGAGATAFAAAPR